MVKSIESVPENGREHDGAVIEQSPEETDESLVEQSSIVPENIDDLLK